MGIVQVKNVKDGSVHTTARANTTGTINGISLQLKMRAFLPNPSLEADRKELGEQCFLTEVIDEFNP